MQSKRGLSTVVSVLIIILLVLVAIGIVWAVVNNLLKEGADQTELGRFSIDLNIKKVTVSDEGLKVQVKRNPGEGELIGIKFVIGDDTETQVFEIPTTMGELSEKTFTLNYVGLVKDVSIAPVFESESGGEIVGNPVDKETLTQDQTIETMGVVSWWKFDGNTNDEIGNNKGELNGDTNCNVEGKFGKACSFDGVNDWINVTDHPSLEINDKVTVSVWAYGKGYYPNAIIFDKIAAYGMNYGYVFIDIGGEGVLDENKNEMVFVFMDEGGVDRVCDSDFNPSTNTWYQFTATYDRISEECKFYVNGDLKKVNNYNQKIRDGSYLRIGGGYLVPGLSEGGVVSFKGIIDEVMIFDRALSEKEVKALYELDLS